MMLFIYLLSDKGIHGKVKNDKLSKNQIDNVIDDRGSDLSCNE